MALSKQLARLMNLLAGRDAGKVPVTCSVGNFSKRELALALERNSPGGYTIARGTAISGLRPELRG